MTTEKQHNIHKVMSQVVAAKLQSYITEGAELNLATCTKIYQDICLALQEVVITVPMLKAAMTEVGFNFMAQAYYDMVDINNGEELDPNIFTKRVKPEELSDKEAQVLLVLFKDTPIAKELFVTLKKRG